MEEKIRLHRRCLNYLILIKRVEKRLSDFKLKLDIERSKPYTQSYLMAGEKYYQREISIKEYALKWLGNRYDLCLKKITGDE